jgi:hypothetical protein
MIPNVLSALRVLLRADADVLAITTSADRIYAGAMPAAESGAQPRAAVVLSRAGGPADLGHMRIGRTRVDVKAYGATEFEAGRLSDEVHETFKALSRARVSGGAPAITATLLHGITLEAGPTDMRDADGDWPMTLRTYLVTAAEVAA